MFFQMMLICSAITVTCCGPPTTPQALQLYKWLLCTNPPSRNQQDPTGPHRTPRTPQHPQHPTAPLIFPTPATGHGDLLLVTGYWFMITGYGYSAELMDTPHQTLLQLWGKEKK